MKRYDKNKSSVQYQSSSTSGPSLLTGYRQEDGLTAVWSVFEESSHLPNNNNTEDNSYRYSEGQVLASSSDLGSWFGVDHVDCHPSRRRKQLYERLWRIDQGLDIDPSNRSLGSEAGHYADPNVDIDSTTSYDIFKYGRADACVQQMDLPRFVQNRVLYLISNQSLKRFNHFGGLEGAIIGCTIRALAEHREMSDVTQVKDSTWWSPIEEFADHLGVVGTTGRKFGQLIDYVQDQYEGGT